MEAFARGALEPWEAGYLDYHGRRYQDTLRLLPEGQGRRLLDVGSFPGHLSALAKHRGWEVTGLNNDIEGAGPWAFFLERCREWKIEILGCDVWVLAERLPTPAAVDAAIERTATDRRAEAAFDYGWWHAAESLYVPHRVTGAAIEIGPGDDAQLGPGWFHREDWGKVGWMRWSGPEAIAYLASPGGAEAVWVRGYAGAAKLGPVSGRIGVEHATPDGPFVPAGARAFALGPDVWEDLRLPIPAAPGRVRVTISVDAPRLPRERIPGSQDARPLGLAVKRLRLA